MPWMSTNTSTIGFIGAGNMATALIEGLLANGYSPASLWASDTSDTRLAALSQKGVCTTADNKHKLFLQLETQMRVRKASLF